MKFEVKKSLDGTIKFKAHLIGTSQEGKVDPKVLKHFGQALIDMVECSSCDTAEIEFPNDPWNS